MIIKSSFPVTFRPQLLITICGQLRLPLSCPLFPALLPMNWLPSLSLAFPALTRRAGVSPVRGKLDSPGLTRGRVGGCEGSQGAYIPLVRGCESSQGAYIPLVGGCEGSQGVYIPLVRGCESSQGAYIPSVRGCGGSQDAYIPSVRGCEVNFHQIIIHQSNH